ncbi:TauD/TfdA family dioxygenase [Micromonospora sp. NPDC048930]|uniref:TauD/TfdA family dioxygenase n=1 Tax=Micromonospora sp. NPDC048930 TaxID=3364261 RepID=UPI003711B442
MQLLEVKNLAEVDSDHLPATLARDGAVLIRQGSVGEVEALLSRWTEPVSHPHQSAEGLTVITPRSRSEDIETEAGFTCAALHPHTDRSLQAHPPSVLAALMVAPARSGGAAALVDGARVLALLRHTFDDAAIAGVRLVPADGSAGRPVIEMAEGLARFRYRDDQVAAPHGGAGSADVLAELRRLISGTAISLSLAAGEGYLVHNHRLLHGRAAFAGSRRLVRFLARVNPDHPYAWLNRGFSVANS